MMQKLKVALVQQKCGDLREENVAASVTAVREAARQGARLVVLQELHCGRYFCQTEDTSFFDQAETIPGPSTDIFGALAHDLGVVIVTSLFERRAPGLYHNTAVILDSDG